MESRLTSSGQENMESLVSIFSRWRTYYPAEWRPAFHHSIRYFHFQAARTRRYQQCLISTLRHPRLWSFHSVHGRFSRTWLEGAWCNYCPCRLCQRHGWRLRSHDLSSPRVSRCCTIRYGTAALLPLSKRQLKSNFWDSALKFTIPCTVTLGSVWSLVWVHDCWIRFLFPPNMTTNLWLP